MKDTVDYSEFLSEITDMISEEVGLEPSEIKTNTPLMSSGLLDSFALVTMLTMIEEKTGFPTAPEDLTLDNFDSLERLLAYLERPRD